MRRLTKIEFWPAAGPADRPWLDQPDEDAFVRSAAEICLRFGDFLRGLPDDRLPSTVASARGMTWSTDPAPPTDAQQQDPDAAGAVSDVTTVLVEVHVDPPRVAESFRVGLPQGIAALSGEVRALLVVEVLHAMLRRLAESRGWDLASVDELKEWVLSDLGAGPGQPGAEQPAGIPQVVVRGIGVDAREQTPRIRVVGGGPARDASETYPRTLEALLGQLETDEWQSWWAQGPIKVLDLYYWFDDRRHGVRVQTRANRATASITRSSRRQKHGAEGEAQARADVEALVTRLRDRFDLPEPPPL